MGWRTNSPIGIDPGRIRAAIDRERRVQVFGKPKAYVLDERGLPAGYAFREEYEITPRDARDALKGGTPLLDVRRADEVAVARVEGAVHIPLGELERRLDELDEYKSSGINVICHMGVRSMRAALMMRQLGFGGARSVAGGIDLWAADIDKTIARYR